MYESNHCWSVPQREGEEVEVLGVPRLAEVEQRAVRRLRPHLQREVRGEAQRRRQRHLHHRVRAHELGVGDYDGCKNLWTSLIMCDHFRVPNHVWTWTRTFIAERPPPAEGAEAEVGPVGVDGALRPLRAGVLPRRAHRRLLPAHHAEPPVGARAATGDII